MSRYRKGIVALLGAVTTVATVVLTGGGWGTVDWVAVAVPVLTAFGVYLAPNEA